MYRCPSPLLSLSQWCPTSDVLHVGPKGSTAPFGVDLGAVPGKTAESSHGPFGHRAKAGALENLETAGDFHGFSWIFMDFHGFSWILMDFDGFLGCSGTEDDMNLVPTVVLPCFSGAQPRKTLKEFVL